jgi:hypothetical protein
MHRQLKLPTFEVESGESIGTATIKINGQQMDGMIAGVGICVKQGDSPKVYLELDVAVIAHFDLVDIKLQQRTKAMLEAMGWTAPPETKGETDG